MKRRGRGEGSVFQRADGFWAAAISLGVADGKRVRRTVYAPTKTELLDKLKDLHADTGKGLKKDGRKLTLGDFLDRYLENAKSRLSPTTYNRYGELVRLHIKPSIGPVRLTELDYSK